VLGGAKITVLFGLGLAVAAPSANAQANGEAKHRITVADTIRMTTLPETTCAERNAGGTRFACFAPDGKQFVLVTETGHPETNENEFSLLLFDTKDVFHHPSAKRLLSMRSRSNRDAIRNVKWVGNERLYFMGEAHNTAQVYSLNVATRQLERWTNHPRPIVDFDVDEQEKVVVYAAEPAPPSKQSVEEKIGRGYAITLETLGEVPRSRADFEEANPAHGEELFVKRPGAKAIHVPLADRFFPFARISVAPNGRNAVFGVLLRDVPASWIEYEDQFIRPEVQAYRRKGATSWLMRYMVVDTKTGSAKPLLPGPVAWSAKGAAWCGRGKSVAVSGAFLPLDVADHGERDLRKKHPLAVEVSLQTGDFEKITDKDVVVTGCDIGSDRVWFRPSSPRPATVYSSFIKRSGSWVEDDRTAEREASGGLPEIVVEQDLNTPPKLYARDPKGGRKGLLLDPNSQFAGFEFGKVEDVTWQAADGHEVEGGLYLPPDYQPGVRYPLVLQTHGFSKDEFWINGPWNSAFAAQPLAARGIVVLQIGHGTEPGGYMKHHRSVEEAPREMAAYEGAIDYLDHRGIIDRERVGIIGFSRTQYHVEYTLTHSSYHFAAATLADGFEGSYLQYLADPYSEKDEVMVNGGPPFGATLAKWVDHSPSFRIDRVHSPIRVECHDWGIVECWEWYSMLTHMGKPVELIYLPDAVHILVKPWERLTSQQGDVDWFCFWLKDEEDQDPGKLEQYERWREMRSTRTDARESQ
jgi:dipeptidyl aminopeptidase/acylaminoacyl peptidase